MILQKKPSGIDNYNLIILIILLTLSSLTSFSQGKGNINLEEISQRKIRKFIISKEIDQMPDLSLIHSSWKKGIRESDFNFSEKIYYLKYRLSKVWDCYRHANPAKAWSGKSVRFGLLISKYANTVSYSDNPSFEEIDTGQVYFLNLRMVKGLFNLPVAFEIITVDSRKQIIEFSYIEDNKSLGKQSIRFFDAGDGNTMIVHDSFFKSGSAFRDDLLYPYFHNKFVKDFHRNMRHLIKETPQAL